MRQLLSSRFHSITYMSDLCRGSFSNWTILIEHKFTWSNHIKYSGCKNCRILSAAVIHLWVQGQLLCQSNQHFHYSSALALPSQIETNLYLHLCTLKIKLLVCWGDILIFEYGQLDTSGTFMEISSNHLSLTIIWCATNSSNTNYS